MSMSRDGREGGDGGDRLRPSSTDSDLYLERITHIVADIHECVRRKSSGAGHGAVRSDVLSEMNT